MGVPPHSWPIVSWCMTVTADGKHSRQNLFVFLLRFVWVLFDPAVGTSYPNRATLLLYYSILN